MTSLDGDVLTFVARPLDLQKAWLDQAGFDLLFLHRRVNSNAENVGCLSLCPLDKLAQAAEAQAHLKRAKPESKIFPSFFCHCSPRCTNQLKEFTRVLHFIFAIPDVCASCFGEFNTLQMCGWCNEPNTGDMECSYFTGCNQCDEKAGWEKDD
jgi:hypothetical protein